MRAFEWLTLFAVSCAVPFAAGCTAQPATESYADVEEGAPDDEAAHSHATGPNGGHIIEFAEDHSIHGEFVVADGVAKLFLTGSDMSTPVEASEAVFDIESEDENGEEVETEIPLVATGEAGVYASAEGALPTGDVEEMHGHLHIVVAGESYDGDLSHGHDDHEGHDHGDHEGHDHGDHEGHDHGHEGHDHSDHKGHDHDHEGHDHGDHDHGEKGGEEA